MYGFASPLSFRKRLSSVVAQTIPLSPHVNVWTMSGTQRRGEERDDTGSAYRAATRALNSRGNGVAALVASVINSLIAYPLDLVKTRFQGNYLF